MVSAVKMLGSLDGPSDQLRNAMQYIVDKIQPALSQKRAQMKAALLWPFSNSEKKDVLARIERLKTFVSCALTGDLL